MKAINKSIILGDADLGYEVYIFESYYLSDEGIDKVGDLIALYCT